MEITRSDYGKYDGEQYYNMIDECSSTLFDKYNVLGSGDFQYIALFLQGTFTGTTIKCGKVEEFIQKFENAK